MFTNIDTLTQSKLQELTLPVKDAQPVILVVQEVKPKSYSRDIQLSEYNLIEGYEILPLNISNNSPGRGMIMYIKDNAKYSPYELNAKFQEGLLCEIEFNNTDKPVIAGMHRSPSSCFENFQELCILFKEVCNLKYTHILLLGDYNIPGIDWKSYTTEKGIDSVEYKFIETIRDCYLYQHIEEATRGKGPDR